MESFLPKNEGYVVAVVCATGAVGETMLEILAELVFPISELFPVASSRGVGSSIEFTGRDYVVLDLV